VAAGDQDQVGKTGRPRRSTERRWRLPSQRLAEQNARRKVRATPLPCKYVRRTRRDGAVDRGGKAGAHEDDVRAKTRSGKDTATPADPNRTQPTYTAAQAAGGEQGGAQNRKRGFFFLRHGISTRGYHILGHIESLVVCPGNAEAQETANGAISVRTTSQKFGEAGPEHRQSTASGNGTARAAPAHRHTAARSPMS